MKTILTAVVATASLLAAVPAAAATLTIDDTTTGGPTFNRPSSMATLSNVGTNVNYDVTPFTVDTAGLYSVGLAADYDTYLFIYTGSFDPASPLLNLTALDDDSGSETNSFLTTALVGGTQYLAVATAFDNGAAGDYTLTFDGPGTITAGMGAVPEPASWAMMIGGFGLAGGALRRRRQVRTTVRFA